MPNNFHRALFLDRDGIINADHSYVYLIKDFDFIDGIFELVAAANAAGYLVVVVTNQSGIGRGYYKEKDFLTLTKWMLGVFELRGAVVDFVYFCPFHPDQGVGEYRRESECRKPNPGMLLRAAREHNIDLARSIMIGDKQSDMDAGQRAGVGKLFYFGVASDAVLGVAINKLIDVIPELD
jgi:D-glycero-D-manno-heptose 1,7-bisphosphate phosphatase